MPGPTKPPWVGSWPEPPPETRATLPSTGASARTTTVDSGRTRIRPECANSMPRSISSTTLSGALMTFFIFSLSLGERGLDRFLRPLLGPGDGLFPPAVEPLALLLVHLGLVAAPETPPALELLLVSPEPCGEPGQVRGPKGCGLQGLRHLHRGPQDVCLELHHPAVGGGPAVGLEGGDVYARVGLHGLHGVARLVAHAFEGSARQMR